MGYPAGFEFLQLEEVLLAGAVGWLHLSGVSQGVHHCHRYRFVVSLHFLTEFGFSLFASWSNGVLFLIRKGLESFWHVQGNPKVVGVIHLRERTIKLELVMFLLLHAFVGVLNWFDLVLTDDDDLLHTLEAPFFLSDLVC
jgi:hypothetical protein